MAIRSAFFRICLLNSSVNMILINNKKWIVFSHDPFSKIVELKNNMLLLF